ncbi:MAG: hypothetical protein DMF73_07990 [Acidobacteria bacterium]|nr:MAG: hypothetical protein DMF73_07990 [Acidobacteriota bacterium]
MLGILGLVLWLGCIICFIIVLIKLFQENGVLHGILGLICGLYTFIWGWINATRLNIKNIMVIWTLLIILSIIVNVTTGGFHYSFGTPATP